MKVLHIGTEKKWRGGENQIFLLSKELEKEKVQSIIAYPKGSHAINEFRSRGLQVYSLNGGGGYHLFDALRLKNFCLKNQISIVHTHSGRGHSLGFLLKLIYPKVSLVVHRRVAFPIKKNFLTRKKYLSDKVDHYIAISNVIAEALIDYGVPHDKVSTIYSAIDDSKYLGLDKEKCRLELSRDFSLDPSKKWIGIVGALTKEKGHKVLFDALKNISDYQCLIAGSGEEREELEKIVENTNLKGKVFFLGFLKDPTPLLKSLDILVTPSFSEGLGTIVLEGMAAGTLVVGSRVGGIPEIIDHRENGYLFEVGNSGELTQCIQEISIDKSSNLKESAELKIKQKFSLTVLGQQALKIYRSLNQDNF